MQRRLWEIDVLRGCAVVAMVVYHFSYDLSYFGLFDREFFRSGLGLDTGRAIGSSFIFLAGLSLTLSYRRAVVSHSPGWKLFRKYLGRGIRIFSYGLVITFATWIFVPKEMILFGVLHLIGVSIILAYPFLKLRLPNLALCACCIVFSLYLPNLVGVNPWLVWLGTKPSFSMLDYWPIFPWFGITLLGVFAGNALYGGQRKRAAPQLPGIRPLSFLGRHSLPVYLIHQPILLATLILLGVGNAHIP